MDGSMEHMNLHAWFKTANVKFRLGFVSGAPTHTHTHNFILLNLSLNVLGCKAVSFDEPKTVLISLNCFS